MPDDFPKLLTIINEDSYVNKNIALEEAIERGKFEMVKELVEIGV